MMTHLSVSTVTIDSPESLRELQWDLLSRQAPPFNLNRVPLPLGELRTTLSEFRSHYAPGDSNP